MTALSSFSDDEKKLLVSLPYQVGVHVSHADDAEGEEDDEQEMRALYSILRALPGLYDKHSLVQEIFKETLIREEEWPSWKAGAFDLQKECSQAITLLKTKATEDEAKAYRKALLEVADAVARAAGEYGIFEIRQEPENAFLKFLQQLGDMLTFTRKSPDHLSNISPSEQTAINKIDDALKV